jgi:hypothetical protein
VRNATAEPQRIGMQMNNSDELELSKVKVAGNGMQANHNATE